MLDKKYILKKREEKRIEILNQWIDGKSMKELHKQYGDFSKAVIMAETSKMKNNIFVIGEE